MQKDALAFGGISLPGFSANAALATLRILAGLSISLAHGLGKMPPSEQFISGVGAMGFPAPVVFAWLASIAECIGGLLVAVGLLTRPAAFMVTCTMLTAGFVAHGSDPFSAKELAFLYAGVFFLFMVIGAGRISIDAIIRKR